jgi:uncharacterized heparinase superfamily protein
MAVGSVSGQGRQMRYALGALSRAAAYRYHASFLYRWRYAGRPPERLLIAPIDLRTADPTVALDIYEGRFVFNGNGVDVDGYSVFDVEPPNEEWVRTLHGFSWLRHLRAADMQIARANARALVGEWMKYTSQYDTIAWEPDVVARRLISWLSQTPLILEGCDYNFYRRFLRSINRQVRHLRRTAFDGQPGLPRLHVMIALAATALSMSDQPRFLKAASRLLDVELVRQILPDGGHVSRNPGATLELLVDLLPLRQAYTARGTQPSRILLSAIDRMMPMLRFFRMGDGAFARFNGLGHTPADLLATVLAYDDVRGTPLANAPHSGYQRIEATGTVVVMDTGRPPPPSFSVDAHAGCLSFEMSVGRQRIILNCGAPGADAGPMRRMARTTAAHSTVTLNDSSSCRFLTNSWVSDSLGEAIVSGPTKVDVDRHAEGDATVVAARHNGYADRYGITHERRISLTDAGDRLEGVDSFLAPSGNPPNRSGKDEFAIRFHLHPAVHATVREDGKSVIMELPDGERWEFETDAPEIALEESILFVDARGSRATDQIVIYGRVQHISTVSWQIHRTALGGRRLRNTATPAITDAR